jgi:hypothetical protein
MRPLPLRPPFSRPRLVRGAGSIVLLFFVFLSACNLFSPESRELGAGYRLKRVGDPPQFAFMIPHESGGIMIDEIGWHQPLIIARASGSEYWEVIDTSQSRHIRVSDADRKLDSAYQKVETEPVATAWNRLHRSKRLW